jgi:hypothetical protein
MMKVMEFVCVSGVVIVVGNVVMIAVVVWYIDESKDESLLLN